MGHLQKYLGAHRCASLATNGGLAGGLNDDCDTDEPGQVAGTNPTVRRYPRTLSEAWPHEAPPVVDGPYRHRPAVTARDVLLAVAIGLGYFAAIAYGLVQ